MNEIIINGESVRPGVRKTILLPMPKLYDYTPMHMPVHVLNGKEPGPVLCVTGAVHGDEINGVEIIRRLLKKSLLKKLKGTVIAVPIVNVYGFLDQSRYLMDRRDLNRSFPGSEKGSLAGRLAYLVKTELLSNATHCIDLHTGSLHRSNFPQIRANLDFDGVETLGRAFGAPVVLHSAEREGSMRQCAGEMGIPLLLYEAGQALRFDELSIRMGLRGILSVMHKLGMIDKEKVLHKSKLHCTVARSSFWVRAPASGIMNPLKTLGKHVKEGDVLGIIGNPLGVEEAKVLAPITGIIIGKTNLPLVHEGAALRPMLCAICGPIL